jgi:hypothetical protein
MILDQRRTLWQRRRLYLSLLAGRVRASLAALMSCKMRVLASFRSNLSIPSCAF